MTDFSDAINWAINNIPMYQFDDFRSWWNEVISNLRGGDKLQSNSNLNRGLEQAWIDEFGSLDNSAKTEQAQDIIPQELQKENIEVPRQNIVIDPETRTPIIIVERDTYPREQERIIPPTGSQPELVVHRQEEKRKVGFITRVRRFLRI